MRLHAIERKNFSGTVAVLTKFFEFQSTLCESLKEAGLKIILGGFRWTDEDFEAAQKLGDDFVYILSGRDLLAIDSLAFNPEKFDMIRWMTERAISVSVTFDNATRAIFTYGGPRQEMTDWERDRFDTRLAWGCSNDWVRQYTGQFGYSYSFLPLAEDEPQIYTHSATFGTRAHRPIIAYVNRNGIESVEGIENGLA